MYYFDKCCWLIITFQSQKLVQKLTLEKSIYFKYLILDDNSMPYQLRTSWQTDKLSLQEMFAHFANSRAEPL